MVGCLESVKISLGRFIGGRFVKALYRWYSNRLGHAVAIDDIPLENLLVKFLWKGEWDVEYY